MNGVNPEIRNRIRVAVAAYAYEVMSDPIMSDDEFDHLAKLIDPRIPTGNERLDEYFRTDFVSFSGVWVRNHPEIEGLERIYRMLKNNKSRSHDQKNNRDLFGPLLFDTNRIENS